MRTASRRVLKKLKNLWGMSGSFFFLFLLFGSALFWISHIIAMINNFDRWSDAVLSAMLVTIIPISLGILGIWYGKKNL